jgi:hypothetical protein
MFIVRTGSTVDANAVKVRSLETSGTKPEGQFPLSLKISDWMQNTKKYSSFARTPWNSVVWVHLVVRGSAEPFTNRAILQRKLGSLAPPNG